MRKRTITDSAWFIAMCVIVIGFCVGWLIGLSVSPVVSIVLTSVTGSIAAIVAALSGLDRNLLDTNEADAKKRLQWRVNPLPLACLTLGIILGSVVGLLVRNNHLLGSDISAEITKWTDLGVPKEQVVHRLLDVYYPQAGFAIPYTQTLSTEVERWLALDMPKNEVVHRLFDRQYPEEGTTNTVTRNTENPLGSILYAVPIEECTGLLAAVARAKLLNDNQQIVTALMSSPHNGLQRLPNIVSNPTILRQLVEEVLCVIG